MEQVQYYNLDYLKELSGGDVAFELEMIHHFIGNTPGVITRLDAYLGEESWKPFRDEVHKFVPNLNMMGVNEIIPVANELERLSELTIETERIPGLYVSFREHVGKALSQLTADFKPES
jgi:HPt (histidine-containing phosphotransfer) domain-containing protein